MTFTNFPKNLSFVIHPHNFNSFRFLLFHCSRSSGTLLIPVWPQLKINCVGMSSISTTAVTWKEIAPFPLQPQSFLQSSLCLNHPFAWRNSSCGEETLPSFDSACIASYGTHTRMECFMTMTSLSVPSKVSICYAVLCTILEKTKFTEALIPRTHWPSTGHSLGCFNKTFFAVKVKPLNKDALRTI